MATIMEESTQPSSKISDCTAPAADAGFSINPQKDCVLFTLPPELRNEIFTLALSQHFDTTRPYPPNAYYTRPGYRFPTRIYTTLLLTCRRVYYEAAHIPKQSYTHTVWFGVQERAPAEHADDPREAPANLGAVPHARFFGQMWQLEGGGVLGRYCATEGFAPRVVTVTIRHSDWWNWETQARLRIRDDWPVRFHPHPALEELRLELETVQANKEELDGIVARQVLRWDMALSDGRKLEFVRREVGGWSWKRNLDAGKPKANEFSSNSLEYYIVTVVWQPVKDATAYR